MEEKIEVSMINDGIFKNFEIKFKDPRMLSPTQLAYIGDAIYEILVRTYLVEKYDFKVNELHKHAIRFVKAEAQAYFLLKLDSILTEEERKIVKRGRNSKISSIPKNATIKDYRYATAFETLFGYLFLRKDVKRLLFLFDKVTEIKECTGDNNENN